MALDLGSVVISKLVCKARNSVSSPCYGRFFLKYDLMYLKTDNVLQSEGIVLSGMEAGIIDLWGQDPFWLILWIVAGVTTLMWVSSQCSNLLIPALLSMNIYNAKVKNKEHAVCHTDNNRRVKYSCSRQFFII